jgi:hypothetical protein
MQDILVAIIISWVLFRLFRPVFFVQWGGGQRSNYSSRGQHHQPEGEVHVTKNNGSQKNVSDDEGEYVDYEEIK